MHFGRGKARLLAEVAVLTERNKTLTDQLAEANKEIARLKEAKPVREMPATRHIGIHGSMDLRATVALTVLGMFAPAVLKDGIVLLPKSLILAMAAASIVALISLGVCLWACLEGTVRPPKHDDNELLKKITKRKLISWNIALVSVVAQGSCFLVGLASIYIW